MPSVKIKHYKCFDTEFEGFDDIKPINVIVGRNNSGKSTLLEIIEYASTGANSLFSNTRGGNTPVVQFSIELTEKELKSVFIEGVSGGGVPGTNHWDYASQWVGETATWEVNPSEIDRKLSLSKPFDFSTWKQYEPRLQDSLSSPFSGRVFKRLFADRDIKREGPDETTDIASDGAGFTSLIRRFINSIQLQPEEVQVGMLEALNSIMRPDVDIDEFTVREDEADNKWEVYFREAEKGKVSLTNSGSGLKTILLVLAFLRLLPKVQNREISEYLFAFEELENNLHPALQRRLLSYLRTFVEENNCTLFLTTHSAVFIDFFSRDDMAQILHVTHDRDISTVENVKTYVQHGKILDDLDVRASDLLQANSIIWVEGPSDRIYFNRWINEWTDGELMEGVHYQCVFYGGRLLSHLTAGESEDRTNDYINLLRVNRNALVIIDSDKKSKSGRTNETKRRIVDEVRNIGGIAWVTKGREIENYIPNTALENYFEEKSIEIPNEFVNFEEFLNDIKPGEGAKYARKKVEFAKDIVPHLVKDELSTWLDLSKRLDEVTTKIREWNSL